MKGQSTNPPAIVIGLDCITGLQTARILASHNIPVIGIANNNDHFCCRTDVCQEILTADLKTLDFIYVLQNLGPRLNQKAVIFPCTDDSVLLLSKNRKMIESWYHILLPADETIEILMNKVNFMTYARVADLPFPTTYLVNNRQHLEIIAPQMTYPCVIKPPMKTKLWQSKNLSKAYLVQNEAELLSIFDKVGQYAPTLLIQQWIDGTDADLYSCNCYFNRDNEPLVTFVARKERQWPPHTGTSSLGIEVKEDAVLEATLQLFQGIGYQGLGYVEMKRDRNTGKFYIIEPNIGRPTGRSAISEAGNVALLYTMYCDALGRLLPENRTQKYQGAKWIYWRHDFQSAFYYWRKGDLSLLDWWRSWRGPKASAVFSWQDPAPFLADLVKSFGLVFRRRGRKQKPVAEITPQHKTI